MYQWMNATSLKFPKSILRKNVFLKISFMDSNQSHVDRAETEDAEESEIVDDILVDWRYCLLIFVEDDADHHSNGCAG